MTLILPANESLIRPGTGRADLPEEFPAALRVDRRCPSESTIRRLLGKVDPDRLDAVLGELVQRLSADVVASVRRRVLAVDGRTVRGSRHTGTTGVQIAGRHLLVVIDQHSRVVLGQIAVETTAAGRPARSTGSPRCLTP